MEHFHVQGFRAAAVEAAIRYRNRLDLGLIVSDVEAVAAGVFTTSLVKAAPVLLDMEHIEDGRARAILVNAGIANACTGEAGLATARATARLTAEKLAIDERLVQVCSTGVIGQQLPVEPFAAAMDGLVARLRPDGLDEVARAIMTTDTVKKTAHRTVTVGGRTVTLAGMAKGAGMIMPNMATMLAFVCTDAAVAAPALRAMVKKAADRSFNAITIDGDTSTNDTVLVLANGLAANPVIEAEDAVFFPTLCDLLRDLAFQIVADGEGATKFVTVRVTGAANDQEADQAARTIANSPLVKTAFFGSDANWGRIIAALGRSGVPFDPYRVDISFDDAPMVRDGLGLGKDAEKLATEVLKGKRFTVGVDLKSGNGCAEVYTCDFSLDYVKINADYRS
ncbi:MAG: bifunctional glutamate N-acetyltransferase/amino-acid acetyltransferase ArgJ [Thermodesulfobacteriota bacterium]